MKKGDLILIPFPFSDLSGRKTRPALILIVDVYDVTVAFITSKTVKQEANDVELFPNSINGLKVDSLVKLNKLATLDKTLILGKIGPNELSSIDRKLLAVFSIKI